MQSTCGGGSGRAGAPAASPSPRISAASHTPHLRRISRRFSPHLPPRCGRHGDAKVEKEVEAALVGEQRVPEPEHVRQVELLRGKGGRGGA